jgi:hypothetical protein
MNGYQRTMYNKSRREKGKKWMMAVHWQLAEPEGLDINFMSTIQRESH